MPNAHAHHHRAHEQCGGHVVGNRRNTKREAARHPVQAPQAEAARHHPSTERIEHAALFHGVDERHGNQQKQKELGVLQQVVPNHFFCDVREGACRLWIACRAGRHGIAPANQRPDDASGHQHRHGFANVQKLFAHHYGVGQHKHHEGGDTHPSRRQIERSGGVCDFNHTVE